MPFKFVKQDKLVKRMHRHVDGTIGMVRDNPVNQGQLSHNNVGEFQSELNRNKEDLEAPIDIEDTKSPEHKAREQTAKLKKKIDKISKMKIDELRKMAKRLKVDTEVSKPQLKVLLVEKLNGQV